MLTFRDVREARARFYRQTAQWPGRIRLGEHAFRELICAEDATSAGINLSFESGDIELCSMHLERDYEDLHHFEVML